ncbi:MAG: nucleotidyltransferase domain-containing protein [archaeon]
MKTLFKPTVYKILKLFYDNQNTPTHLRLIARKTSMNESSVSRQLNLLEKNKILKSIKEANLKKFYINYKQIPIIFPLFDQEKLDSLPLLRQDAIKEYIKALKHKPILLIVFGSTAKNNFTEESDIDILEVSNAKEDEKAKKHVSAITAQNLQIFRINETRFYKELKTKEENLIQIALKTGFPAFNKEYFYQLIYNERARLEQTITGQRIS